MIDVGDGHRSEVHAQGQRNKDHVPPCLLCEGGVAPTRTTTDMLAGEFPKNVDMIVHLLNELNKKRQGHIQKVTTKVSGMLMSKPRTCYNPN